jgi:hypothetical protein
MRPKETARALGAGIAHLLCKLFAGPDPEIGPLEMSIIAVAVGVYLLVAALWPKGALGAGLFVAGGIQLGVRLWVEGKARAPKKGGPL